MMNHDELSIYDSMTLMLALAVSFLIWLIVCVKVPGLSIACKGQQHQERWR